MFDFDRCTGLLGNPVKVEYETGFEPSNGAAGIAFSPSGRFVYMTYMKDAGIRLVQYDLGATDIAASEFLIAECPVPVSPFECSLGFPLLTPDGKIYVSALIDTVAFHIIHQPDSLGLACDFEFGGFAFPEKFPSGGVPYFPNYRLYDVPGSACDTLGVDGPVSAGEVERTAAIFGVYPNPTNGRYNISHNLKGSQKGKVRVFDLYGHVLESHDLAGASVPLSLEGLPTGVYFLQFSINGKLVQIEKLIKF